jgi:hypothetical protein
MEKVTVTKQMLDDNPELAKDGIKVGEVIETEGAGADEAPAKSGSSIKVGPSDDPKDDKRTQRIKTNAKKELKQMVKELES